MGNTSCLFSHIVRDPQRNCFPCALADDFASGYNDWNRTEAFLQCLWLQQTGSCLPPLHLTSYCPQRGDDSPWVKLPSLIPVNIWVMLCPSFLYSSRKIEGTWKTHVGWQYVWKTKVLWKASTAVKERDTVKALIFLVHSRASYVAHSTDGL